VAILDELLCFPLKSRVIISNDILNEVKLYMNIKEFTITDKVIR
jgi:hypothetical protein